MIKHSENYDIKQFTYVKESKCFASEASSLGIKPGDKFPYMFFIENTETGNRALFTYASTERNEDNELQSVNYKGISALGTFTAKIFND
jgi:hypothetical protein